MLAKAISAELGLDLGYIERIARTASHHYKHYTIDKRSGGTRDIYHPSRELKSLQRWILKRIIRTDSFPVHESVFAYERGMSIVKHARAHANSRFLLRMDFINFFESIEADDIEILIDDSRARLQPDWTSDDTELFCSIVCRRGRLTMGAVTSPSLSNRVCIRLDGKLKDLASEHDSCYTRYADDMYFSSNLPDRLGLIEKRIPDIVAGLSLPQNLRLNLDKTRHTSRKQRRVVTGVVITCNGDVSLGRPLKRKIRHFAFRWDELTSKERAWLSGMLAYGRQVEPDFINRLFLKYGHEKVFEIMQFST